LGSWRDRVKRYYEAFDKVVGTLKNIGMIAVGVWAYVYAWGGRSHTSFHFAEANSEVIKLTVSTEAPKLKPAYLREFCMSFGKLQIEDVQLRLVSDNVDHTWAVVQPGEPAVVRLTVDRLRGRCRAKVLSEQTDRFTKGEILSDVATGQATVTIFVQESNDKGTERHCLKQVVPTKALETFIDNYLPAHIPAKTSCDQIPKKISCDQMFGKTSC